MQGELPRAILLLEGMSVGVLMGQPVRRRGKGLSNSNGHLHREVRKACGGTCQYGNGLPFFVQRPKYIQGLSKSVGRIARLQIGNDEHLSLIGH